MIWACPYGSGFPLQVLARSARSGLSAAIPHAKRERDLPSLFPLTLALFFANFPGTHRPTHLTQHISPEASQAKATHKVNAPTTPRINQA
ncbi:MAG: hypothetical protein LBJ39_02460 [Tannerellaceae bacterium]|nr:hypothetical protein [Tannerellaceae bacterium]